MLSHLRVRAPLIRIALVATLAFSLGSAGLALGLVVNSAVEACYNNATGILRLATATTPCMTEARFGLLRETAISWNQDSAAEAAARAAADTTLQSNIASEAASRLAADTALQSNITNEASARQAADRQLQTNIDSEAASRRAADTATLAAANGYTDGKTRANASVTQSIFGVTIGTTATEFVAATIIIPIGSAHSVLVVGQVQLVCAACAVTDVVVVQSQLKRGSTFVGMPWTTSVTASNSPVVVPLSHLDFAEQGTHQYAIVLTQISSTGPTATAARAALHVADLGKM